MLKKVCDRCGATIKYPEMRYTFKWHHHYTLIGLKKEMHQMVKSDEIDLCDNCWDGFVKWLESAGRIY